LCWRVLSCFFIYTRQQASDLFKAAEAGDEKECSRLLGSGASPLIYNKEYDDGSEVFASTATHAAARGGHAGVLRALCDALRRLEAPVDCCDKDGATPLMLAVAHGHADAAAVLLRAGASCDAEDDSQTSALMRARDKGGALEELLLCDWAATEEEKEAQLEVRRGRGGARTLHANIFGTNISKI
jgi:ankyrin repeat protein